MDEKKRSLAEHARLLHGIQGLRDAVSSLDTIAANYDKMGISSISDLAPELADTLDQLAVFVQNVAEFFSARREVNYPLIERLIRSSALKNGFRSMIPLPLWFYPERGMQVNLNSSADAETSPIQPTTGDDRISVDAYLDTDNQDVIDNVLRYVDDIVLTLGYGKPEGITVERGSIFRRSFSRAKETLTSAEMKERLEKIERAVEVQGLLLPQAEVDFKISQAVSGIIASLANTPSACIRAGSIMLIKYQTDEGPVILTRNLSVHEIRTLERFPGIQKEPSKALDLLATTIQSLESEISTQVDSPDV
ncbi:hypothetical protein [Amycolatopsis lexingtonensis]|uniref:hypothetical protein n=1 Tax=Amycolatopsis lexingtonensis TaxID=218822 RepID=UPI003F704BA8